MGAAAKLEQQAVLADLTVGAEAFGGCGQVDGAVVLVNLDGVAAAEGDMRAAFAPQMAKLRRPQTSQSGRGRAAEISERSSATGPRKAGCGAWHRARQSSI